MEQLGVDYFSAEQVHARGIGWVLERVLPALKGKRVHISFDVDSLDPAEFSSTGYLIPGGLTFAQVRQIVRAAADTGALVSFECVEYNPALDKSGADGKKLMEFYAFLRTCLEQY